MRDEVTLKVGLALEVAAAALVCGVAALIVPEPSRTSAYLGVAAAVGVGVAALLLKLKVPALMKGAAEVRAVLAMTGLAFGLRLLVLGVGAIALKQRDAAPEAFVIAFFVVYLVQQLVEVRTVSKRRAVAQEVSR